MEINKNCSLVLNTVYSYDISSCHMNILKRLGFNVTELQATDKVTRNIKIGLMEKENERLSNILRSITNSTINDYLNRNHINSDDLITRQYDGFISKKPLNTLDLHLPLGLREIFDTFIISSDRKNYIALSSKGTTIKGISNRYPRMDEFYSKILKINYNNKESIFRNLQLIKDEILTSSDPYLYTIPVDEQYIIHLNNYGPTRISKNIIRMLDTKDLNRMEYYNQYIKPFAESIILTFL